MRRRGRQALELGQVRAGAARVRRRRRLGEKRAPGGEGQLAVAGDLVAERLVVALVAGRLEEDALVGEVRHRRVELEGVADGFARLLDLLVAVEGDAEAPLGELPLEAALLRRRLGAAVALDGGVEAAERHHRLGGVAVEDRAAEVVEDARAALGVDELERAVVLAERLFVASRGGRR